MINTLKRCLKSAPDCVATLSLWHKKLASTICAKLLMEDPVVSKRWSATCGKQSFPLLNTSLKDYSASIVVQKDSHPGRMGENTPFFRTSVSVRESPIGVAFGILRNGGVVRVHVATLKGVACGISRTITKRLDLTSGSSLGFCLRPHNRRDLNPVAIAKPGTKKSAFRYACSEERSMEQYVSRRRRSWTPLTQMDPVIHLSERHRSDMLLDLSGMTREKACRREGLN